MNNEKFIINGNLYSIIIFAVIIRLCVSLHSYSGRNKPPMFGDYEAQRHWMEITVNLEPQKWYFNSSDNDLLYWGLDYPPLTAYHSYINGKIASYINPDFIALLKSRGFESYEHKFFMRMTVIVADVAAYFVPVVLVFRSIFKSNKNFFELKYGENSNVYQTKSSLRISNSSVTYLAQIAITLLYPGLILIDHGHFQYNSVSLGLTIYAVHALLYNRFMVSAFFFCLALNYKQMSLYHSLPFFVYMLSKCLCFKKPFLFTIGIKRFVSLSLTVLITFGIIWFPFLDEKDGVNQVIKRLFPLSRRIFEDKVSNFWCVINLFYKLNLVADQIKLAKICIALVLLTSTPSLFNLFKNSTLLRFLLCLINVSLSFFLFSYQVHEKSILLIALPVLIYFPFDPFPCFWFLIISNFSMMPLFLKDNLLIPFISLSLLFGLFVSASVDFQTHLDRKLNRKVIIKLSNIIVFINLFKLSMIGCIILVFCSVIIKPPTRYPDLWPLLVSVYSFGHFFLFTLYFNFAQIFQTLD